MSRSKRLVDLVRALKEAAPGALTAKALAERFSVSERTIYRDMSKLIESGIPIEGEAGLGYVLAPGDGPPMPALTWRQAETLWRGARIISLVAREEGAQTAARSLAALSAVLGDDRVQRLAAEPVLPEPGELKPVPAVLNALERAIDAGRTLRVDYVELDESEMKIEGRPSALTMIGDAVILTLDTEAGPRPLRAERIKRLTVTAANTGR